MIITNAWIADVASRGGGWSAVQLALLGVSWPPTPGWRRRLIGTTLSDDIAQRVAALSGVRFSKSQRRAHLDAIAAHRPLPVSPPLRTPSLFDTHDGV